jgi:acyl-CoA hydrolase
MKPVSPIEAVSHISSGDHVYVHGMAAAPSTLLCALSQRSEELRNVDMIHLHTEGPAPHLAPDMAKSFHHTALFVGPHAREAVQDGRADYIPMFLSEVPTAIRSGVIPVDVALIHVSPPDRHGYCSLGISVEGTLAATKVAKKVIAQINPNMPRGHGDGFIHVNQLAAATMVDDPMHEIRITAPDAVEAQIGRYVAELVEDGSTLQMGIGAIPDAVLGQLRSHRNLGVHTEMFSDGLVDLFEAGVVTNAEKRVYTGKTVATFVLGTNKTYNFIDDNPDVAMLDVAFVNDTSVIRRNPKVTAINSAIEVDITGQVCADSIGSKMYSGVGGQMDFIRGASLSEGGKPIIALPSRTNKGIGRIVSTLKPAAGVVTTRAHVHYVVTEYGIANLYGKNLRQRAKALIEISHPEDRERLEREACERFGHLTC